MICARPGCEVTFIPRTIRHIYCSEHCRRYRPDTGPAKPSISHYTPRETHFIGIDGEGIGRGREHQYVLLGIGQEQREWPEGVRNIAEIFSFVYDAYRANPHATFAGFYLPYDFNMWLRLLPRERAWMLLSPKGIAKRARLSRNGQRLGPFPVEYKDWQFDMLGYKRFKLRPAGEKGWMYICDGGPFFQCSLLSAINPAKWIDPIVTPEEYALLQAGKERRAEAVLDDDMRFYNRLENEVFARLMTVYCDGLAHANVRLKKQQWFGPGQAAQAWMRLGNKLDSTTRRVSNLGRPVLDAAISTYYGGWFEIPIHGHVPGTVYEYDINSAYPYIASRLPCLCGAWKHGTGSPPRQTYTPCMVNVIARGKDMVLGGLPYRRYDGRVLRPHYTEGWYWAEEIRAAQAAGLISEVSPLEWWAYNGCKHTPPLDALSDLYTSRLRIGKDTPAGKAFKLVYNSVYGKLAQSEGMPAFANPFYASLITSGCRQMVLRAIASHPNGSKATAMVATDGIYFLSPHPELDQHISERMGDWSLAERHNMTLFKPGVYWDDVARAAIARGEAPQFKARGINAKDFAKSLASVDDQFDNWHTEGITWPSVSFRARFAQVSVRQALDWTEAMLEPKRRAVYRAQAGRIMENRTLTQDSDPSVKRNPLHVEHDGRVWRTRPWDGGPHWPASAPYEKRFGVDDDGGWNTLATSDGPVMMSFRQALGVG
jgi:hypothetical protein